LGPALAWGCRAGRGRGRRFSSLRKDYGWRLADGTGFGGSGSQSSSRIFVASALVAQFRPGELPGLVQRQAPAYSEMTMYVAGPYLRLAGRVSSARACRTTAPALIPL